MYGNQDVTMENAYFGAGSGEQMELLHKALSTGTDGAPAAVPGSVDSPAGALRVESLESTLKTTTFRMEHIKFWRAIAKKRAFSTVEEYNVLSDYGSDASAFFDEGGLPREEDATYERKYQVVKFLGVTKIITQPLLLVRAAHGDVLARETINGTMWILERLEKALFFGNAIINSLQFNGIAAQVIPQSNFDQVRNAAGTTTLSLYGGGGTDLNVIDLRGGPMTEETLEEASQRIADFYGRMQCLFMGTRALSDLAKTFFPKERIHLPAPTDGVVGTPLTHFASQNGYIRLEPDVFIRPGGAIPVKILATAPAAPTNFAVAASAGVVPGSEMEANDYDYAVTAVNKGGEEGAAAYVTGVTLADAGSVGDAAVMQWDRAVAAVSYKLYRRVASTGAYALMLEVPDLKSPIGVDAKIYFDDLNRWLPGTSMAFGMYMDAEQGMAFKQLAPLMKVNLATLSAAIRFMILLYGVPEVYSPTKQIIFKNIGPLTT
jgi:hypothetical protein